MGPPTGLGLNQALEEVVEMERKIISNPVDFEIN